jgi:ribonuclease D
MSIQNSDGNLPNLNAVAKKYGLRPNTAKNNCIYKTNPSFWTTRPLTEEMIQWASEDVQQLHEIARLQDATLSNKQFKAAKEKSNDYANLLVSMKSQVFGYHPGERKKNILNWRALQYRTGTGTKIYGYDSEAEYAQFIVYYKTKKQLRAIKKAMGIQPDNI